MQITSDSLVRYLMGPIECREQDGKLFRTISPYQASVLANKGFVEGVARVRRCSETGEKVPVLIHLKATVPITRVAQYLNLVAPNDVKIAAIGSRTWMQVGRTTFWHNPQRCNAFNDYNRPKVKPL